MVAPSQVHGSRVNLSQGTSHPKAGLQLRRSLLHGTIFGQPPLFVRVYTLIYGIGMLSSAEREYVSYLHDND